MIYQLNNRAISIVAVTDNDVEIVLNDETQFFVSLSDYQQFDNSTRAKRENVIIDKYGFALTWPDIGATISLNDLMSDQNAINALPHVTDIEPAMSF